MNSDDTTSTQANTMHATQTIKQNLSLTIQKQDPVLVASCSQGTSDELPFYQNAGTSDGNVCTQKTTKDDLSLTKASITHLVIGNTKPY